MDERSIIETACKISGSISGWNRYVRVNDYVIDTIERKIVAMAWPRASRKSFPVRQRGDSVAECLI